MFPYSPEQEWALPRQPAEGVSAGGAGGGGIEPVTLLCCVVTDGNFYDFCRGDLHTFLEPKGVNHFAFDVDFLILWNLELLVRTVFQC